MDGTWSRSPSTPGASGVCSVNLWFARVVYERDGWDEWLTELSGKLDLRIGIVLYVARFFVWLTRRVLWALMMFGHAISCFLMRQMEFDADRSEARVAGADTFEKTAKQLAVLGVASQVSHAILGSAAEAGRLADDLPALVLGSVGHIPKAALPAIREQLQESSTGLFDTHPSDRDRIASARREATDGIFRVEAPARILFSQYDATCREITLRYYRDELGLLFDDDCLVSSAELLQNVRAD